MLSEIKNWINSNKIKTGLLVFELAFFSLAIIFSRLGMLPIAKTGDLIFWLVLIFALALYRPGWAFLFFTGAIVLENISLTAPEIGFNLRIYQALGALIIAAIAVRWALKKSVLAPLRLTKPDYLILAFLGGSLLSALFSAERGASLKIALIILSFTALYFLTRIYIQDSIDLKKILPFFLVAALGVVIYGILQNIFFSQGWVFHGEVMPGRPNATFTEPDWLGIYLVFLLAVVYSLVYYFNKERDNQLSLNPKSQIPNPKQIPNPNFQKYLIVYTLYIILIPIYILLIITVSRSAWLGAGFITLVFLKAILTDFSWHFNNWRWKMFLHQMVFVVCSGAVSLLIIYGFNLTNFQLFNRAASSSGLQKITVACESRSDLDLPKQINSSAELIRYGCRHINLEDIEKERSAGNHVTEVYRPDPNVNIRGQIFQKSWEAIKTHPILGVGYGSIYTFLGRDERGISLNSSNIFLEVWLGSGLMGLLAFMLIWLNAIIVFVKRFWRAESQEEKAFALFILLGIFALLIPNLFNAGIFLMLLWFFWGIIPIKFNEK
jgi:hypothetical protein